MSSESLILLLESATESCSVALSKGETLIAEKCSFVGKAHDTLMAPFIDEILKENNVKVSDLAAVAVSQGPGSYMGLRIGVSLAKGIAYAGGCKIIGVSTLAAIARCALDNTSFNAELIVPMIDAGRMEVYTATFNSNGEQLTKTEAKILTKESFSEEIASKRVLFAGNGVEKFKKLLESEGVNLSNSLFMNQLPKAAGLRVEATKKLEAGDLADLAYFQPEYLKEFIPGKQKKLL